MSLFMDVQNYLRRYGSATQSELAQQMRTSAEIIQMMAEKLHAKGKIRMSRVMPSCVSGSCSGSCCTAIGPQTAQRQAVRVYHWVERRGEKVHS